MNKFVVFDTNAYRVSVRGKSAEEVMSYFSHIRELEIKKNIKAICHIFTGYELLPYLSKPYKSDSFIECLKIYFSFGIYKSRSYTECYKSIIALGTHCWDDSTTPKGIISIPQTSLLLTNTFFNGRRNTLTEGLNQNLIGFIQAIKVQGKSFIKKQRETLEKIEEDIALKERDFADRISFLISELSKIIVGMNSGKDRKTIKKLTIKAFNGEEFRTVMAKALLSIYASTISVTLSEKELSDGAKILNEKFPIAAGFHTWVCHEVFSKNIDLYSKKSQNKRWNWLWDAEISCVISESLIGGRETLLVTGDGPMTDVISKYGYQDRVMTLEKYLQLIET